MNSDSIFFKTGRILILFIYFTGIFTATYFITPYFFQIIHWQPSAMQSQIISSLLGLFLGLLLILGLGNIFRSKRMKIEERMIGPIINALEKITLGDYDIVLENNTNPHFPEHELIEILKNSINEMALELSQLEAMRQEFVTNVSHEIQSPLTSIRGFTRVLRSNDLNLEERLHYLNIIEAESIRLSRISDNLLQLSSLDSENLQPDLKSFRLDQQIKNLVLACEPQWMEKEIEMNLSLEKVSINADEDLLSQVWINLIHNSIKFTPQAGSINIKLLKQDTNIEFRITDTGIGISEEDSPHVFERFYKADKSRERSNKGSGLGLSIAKKIIEIHHGKIELQSQLGMGSTFIVSIPTLE